MSVKASKTHSNVQGEGDYEAARRYQRRSEKFMANHDIDDIESEVRSAAPRNSKEAIELAEAEARARSRANHSPAPGVSKQ